MVKDTPRSACRGTDEAAVTRCRTSKYPFEPLIRSCSVSPSQSPYPSGMYVRKKRVTAFPTGMVTNVVSDVSSWLAGWLLGHSVGLLGSHLPSKILELLLQGGCRVPLPASDLHGIRNTAPLFILKLFLDILLALDQLCLLFAQLVHITDSNKKKKNK